MFSARPDRREIRPPLRGAAPTSHPMTRFPAALPGLSILSRLLAAVLGGYLLASALAMFLPAALPGSRAEAVLAGVQWSFALHVLAVVWAFSPLSLARVWWGLLGFAAALAGLAAVIGLWTRGGA